MNLPADTNTPTSRYNFGKYNPSLVHSFNILYRVSHNCPPPHYNICVTKSIQTHFGTCCYDIKW